MRTSLLLFQPASPKTSSMGGPLESMHGSLIEISPTHISTPRLVRLIAHALCDAPHS